MTPKQRHNLDLALCQQGIELDEIHTTSEQNGAEIDEATVIYGWFRDWRNDEDELPPVA